MTEREAFVKRERWLEERYFRGREEELIMRLGRRRELREMTGISDEQILNDLQKLGYTGETVKRLLYLVPLLQVAWSEGFVTERERRRIIEIARQEGIREGTFAYRQLGIWLDQRPSAEFFAKTLRIIRHLLGLLTVAEREKRKRDLMTRCLLVASASGSILEFWMSISATEWGVLRQLAAELDDEQGTAVRLANVPVRSMSI